MEGGHACHLHLVGRVLAEQAAGQPRLLHLVSLHRPRREQLQQLPWLERVLACLWREVEHAVEGGDERRVVDAHEDVGVREERASGRASLSSSRAAAAAVYS